VTHYPAAITGAGLVLDRLQTYYASDPRVFGYNYEGVARKRFPYTTA
jgi:hypothetical protein